MNLVSLLDAPARSVPERPALVFDDRRLSYGELADAVAACAAALAERGVRAGDRIALLDDTSPLHVACVLGAARIGAAAVPLHVELTERELAELVETAGCGPVGVAGERHRPKLSAALGAPVLGERELLSGPAHGPPEVVDEPSLDCVVILTSGTTGLPKPVGVSHGVLAPRIRGFAGRFDPDRRPATSLSCVPAVHIGGLGGLLTGLAGGATIVVQARFDAGGWLRRVAEHRVTAAFLVPTMLRRILDHPDFGSADLSSLRSLSYGAAAAPVALVEEMIRRFPDRVAFANVFGQTETTGAIASFGPADHQLDAEGRLRKAGSVGRPLPGVEIRITRAGSDAEVGPEEAGELQVRSPFNARRGWRRTGDTVRRDADGYLYPVGRLSDTIQRGGEKFGPSEIEDVLRRHPAVADVAVAGVPDAELGERVGAAIVRRGPLSEEQVREHCRASLARFKVPERIAFVDEIPHTALFKISRRTIADLIARAS